MERSELAKKLEEKKEIRERLQTSFAQLVGQIALLEDLIKQEDTPKEEVKKE